jgi:hypothetical protein
VVVVDNYDHHRTPPGLDESTYTPANASVGVHFSVVLPPFFGPDTAAADRTRHLPGPTTQRSTCATPL